MAKTSKVSKEDYEKRTSKLYADLGRIAVHSEHLNDAMHMACMFVLTQKGLPSQYATTVLAGMNLENSRRLWVSLMKLAYRGNKEANAKLEHLSTRIDNVRHRRNNNIHRVWYIGWGNEETPSYEMADSIKIVRDVSDKGQGGVKVSSKDTKDFGEIIDELIVLKELVMRLAGCFIGNFDVAKNFHYKNNKLMPGPARSLTETSGPVL